MNTELNAECLTVFTAVDAQLTKLGAMLAENTRAFREMLEFSQLAGACRPELLPPGWDRQTEKLRRSYELVKELSEVLTPSDV